MKPVTYLTLFFICVFCEINAQNSITPNSNKYTVYIDNIIVGNETGMDFSKIPMVLFENYYKGNIDLYTNQCFPKMIKEIFLERDTVNNTNNLHIRTKKAKDGYILINKNIADEIKECCNDFSEAIVSYVYNGKVISTKNGVKKMLRLRVKKIKILSITQDEKTKVITANFADK